MNDRNLIANPKQTQSPNQPSPVVKSDQLFGGAVEVIIDHEGVAYRLRRTRNGKLILNK